MNTNIRLAVDHAKKKHDLGLLVWDEIPDQEEIGEEELQKWWTTPNGDRETIYSIASMFTSDNIGGDKTTEEDIVNVLSELYPNHC